jgi:hypothetical protein
LYNVFGARAPVENSTEFYKLQSLDVTFTPGQGRSAKRQALFQLAGLGATVVIAVIGGLLTGKIMKLSLSLILTFTIASPTVQYANIFSWYTGNIPLVTCIVNVYNFKLSIIKLIIVNIGFTMIKYEYDFSNSSYNE